MNFRITPSRQYQTGLLQAQRQTLEISKLTTNISSGIRIHQPSDDPRAQKLLLDQQAVTAHFESQTQVIQSVRTVLNEGHNQLRSAQQLVVKARDVALQARQITDSAEARIFARDIDTVLKSVKQIAASRQDGRYLFSGADTQVPPFAEINGTFSYQGSVQVATAQVAGAESITVHYSGSYVFSTGNGGTTSVRGNTGAVGGSGTASGHGRADLQIQHTATSFGGSSGVTAGISSATGDTIIGDTGTHTLEVVDTSGTGSAGTITLNGGNPVAFTSSDTDLEVIGPDGEIVFVDTTAVTAGFSGSIDLTASGTMSLDGGITQVPIDFTENQSLTDQDGNIRHIDSRNVSLTGTDTVSLKGSVDLFESLRTFRDMLENYDEVSAAELDYETGEAIGDFDQLSNHLLDVVGEQSVDLATLDRVESRAGDQLLESQKLISQLEGTNFPEAVVKLQEMQNLNQYTIATLARVAQISVLDYLR